MSTYLLLRKYLFVLIIISLGILLTDGLGRFSNPLESNLKSVKTVHNIESQVGGDVQVSKVNSSSIKVQKAGFGDSGFFNYFSSITLEHINGLLERILVALLIFATVYFSLKKKISTYFKFRMLPFLLIAVGYLMVIYLEANTGWAIQSGNLQIKVVLEILLAIITFSYVLWLFLDIQRMTFGVNKREVVKPMRNLLRYFLPLLTLMIIFEVLVRAADGVPLFPMWPRLGGFWLPLGVGTRPSTGGMLQILTDELSLRFIQRMLTYFVLIFVAVLWYRSRNLPSDSKTRGGINILLVTIGFQFLLGFIAHFLYSKEFVGFLHSIGSVVLLSVSIYLYHLSVDLATKLGFNSRSLIPKRLNY